MIRAVSLILALTLAAAPVRVDAAPIGKAAPGFQLEDLHGRKVTSGSLRRPTVLVVGGTQKAAPPCKEWALALLKRHGEKLSLYQVIVVDKAWYIPRGAVVSKVKDFVPPALHGRVLLEWYRVFANLYGIPKHDDPVILVIGPDGVLRLQHRAHPSEAGFKLVGELLRSLARARSPHVSK